jgi:hypothetical protein
LNWKIALIKGEKKNQKNESQTKKNKTIKKLFKGWNWKEKKTSTKVSRTKLEIKKKWGTKWKTKHMRNYNWRIKLKRIKLL